MYIDMHCHSITSDDSKATVDQYVKWITFLRKKGYTIDGIVLTEHRTFDADKDYSDLANTYSLVILKGSELDTLYGHFLVYGMNEHLMRSFDLADVHLDPIALMREARCSGAIALPAHPGRFGIGLCEFVNDGADFSDVFVVEKLNGGSRPGENERAAEFSDSRSYQGIGGSDAHFVSAIGTCLTAFPKTIDSEQELVQALKQQGYHPVYLEETRQASTSSRSPL